MEDLDLKELFNIFWQKKIHIVLITLIFIVLGILYSFLYVKPRYKSYTKLVLATTSEGTSSTDTITTSDITLNNNLVSTYSELIKSKSIMRQVIENLGINMTENALKSSVTVSAVKSTQVIQIDVVNSDPEQAKVIANEVAKVFSEEVPKIYNINNV